MSQHGKGNSHPSPQNTQSTRQDKPKKDHTETYGCQIDKTKYKEKILKTKMEKQQIIYKGIPKVIS